jgi:hypothetical protein
MGNTVPVFFQRILSGHYVKKRTSRHYLILAILYSLGVEGWRIFGRHGVGPLFSFHTLVSHDFEDIKVGIDPCFSSPGV